MVSVILKESSRAACNFAFKISDIAEFQISLADLLTKFAFKIWTLAQIQVILANFMKRQSYTLISLGSNSMMKTVQRDSKLPKIMYSNDPFQND